MTITLSAMQDSEPDFIDVRYEPLDDVFRLHRLGLTDLLELSKALDRANEDGEIDESGSMDIAKMSQLLAPLMAKSLQGEWDTETGIDYLQRRPDLMTLLIRELTKLCGLDMLSADATAPEDTAKND